MTNQDPLQHHCVQLLTRPRDKGMKLPRTSIKTEVMSFHDAQDRALDAVRSALQDEDVSTVEIARSHSDGRPWFAVTSKGFSLIES